MPFLSNFWQWPAAAVHKKILGAVLFRSEFKSLSNLLQQRTLWPARSEVGRCRPMCVRVSAVVPSRRVDPLMGRNPLSTDTSRPLVADEVWRAAQARPAATNKRWHANLKQPLTENRGRPSKQLFQPRCGTCGATFTMANSSKLGCSKHRNSRRRFQSNWLISSW
jgi:hypothetical protein